MKKIIIAIGFVLSISCLYSFTMNDRSNEKSDSWLGIDMFEMKTISVVRITGGCIKNFNFSGKYDTEENFIRIYNKEGKEVASGKPKINYDRKGCRENYNAHLDGTYYFNI